MRGRFYAICLFLACLSALMLGFSCGSVEPVKSDRSKVTDIKSIEREGTVEAQGSFLDYNEYEQGVSELINDRGVQ